MYVNIIVFYKTSYKILSINTVLFPLNVDFYYNSTAFSVNYETGVVVSV